MSKSISATWEKAGLHAVLAATKKGGLDKAIAKACSKASSTALRDMRSEASKRIRARKRIKVAYVRKAIVLVKADKGTIDGISFGVRFTGEKVPLSAYPHRQTKAGVVVEVNVGKKTLLEHAFIANSKSGIEAVFKRKGKARLPLEELLGSRPVDAMLHAGEAEAVAQRGATSFGATFDRLLPLEVQKLGGK